MENTENKPWIFILTHGKFGEELRNSAEMILGELQHVYCFSLLEEMDPKDFTLQIKEIIKEAPENSIILTDLYGGTPSNVGATFSRDFPVISGVNLPMLIEAEMCRFQNNWDYFDDRISSVAVEGIKNISKIMNSREV